jgi:hypothetical protein
MTKSEAEMTNQPPLIVFGRSDNIGRMFLTVEGQAQISEGLSQCGRPRAEITFPHAFRVHVASHHMLFILLQRQICHDWTSGIIRV